MNQPWYASQCEHLLTPVAGNARFVRGTPLATRRLGMDHGKIQKPGNSLFWSRLQILRMLMVCLSLSPFSLPQRKGEKKQMLMSLVWLVDRGYTDIIWYHQISRYKHSNKCRICHKRCRTNLGMRTRLVEEGQASGLNQIGNDMALWYVLSCHTGWS